MGPSWIVARVRYAEKHRTSIRPFHLHTAALPDGSVWSVVLRAVLGEKDLALVSVLSDQFPAELLRPGTSLDLYRGANLIATIEPQDPQIPMPFTPSGVPDAGSDSEAVKPREAEPRHVLALDNPDGVEDPCGVCGSQSCILTEEACQEACDAFQNRADGPGPVDSFKVVKVIRALSYVLPTDAEMADQALDRADRLSKQRDEARARVKELEARLTALLEHPRGFESHFVDVARERLNAQTFKILLETAQRRAL